MNKFVYLFSEGNKDMRELLGGKGANLAEMKSLNLPVPDGFTVTTETCNKYYEDGMIIDENIINQIFDSVTSLEKNTNKIFGDISNPLLLSVRSGARASMPGMMDTILNLGLNDKIVENISNKRFAYDSYRRLIQMYSDVVKGYPKSEFEDVLSEFKEKKNTKSDLDLDEFDLKEIVNRFKSIYLKYANEEFPQEPKLQLIEAITAVFRSWNNERAIVYRKMNDIPDEWGTAVNVQEMVYGNNGDNSGTGVAFTRNPANGDNHLYGEYLINAQGEDVVAGIRTPLPIATLEESMPEIYKEFVNISKMLESHYKDMQDMEFTIENGKLYMLQTRNGKRTAAAALKIAVDMVNEELISKEEALLKVEPNNLEQLLHPTFDNDMINSLKPIATGLAASPGAGCGQIYFDVKALKEAKSRGEDTLLVRLETSPEDIEGMKDAKGILTIRGGMTSHAAVVARGMGRCCISGCDDLIIDEANKTIADKEGNIYKEGDYLSLDGSTGNVYGIEVDTVEPTISGDFEIFMNWADDVKKLHVRTNADTPKDAITAKKYGAEGIGLCRTEHMFFDKDRIFNFRKMILADSKEDRVKALDNILPYQIDDFTKLYEAMEGSPVVIRYLDPPLHEFLPKTLEEKQELADSMNISIDKIEERISSLKEFNPMMGHRGCRLSITYPEIAVMQTMAVILSAMEVNKKGIKVVPEIMIPLVGDISELNYIKNLVDSTVKQVLNGYDMKYMVGTMIEIPRACIVADELAREAEFFSFGTNDLTQLTYGFSRDDSSKFLSDYYEKKVFESDPFARIDQKGVGKLIEVAIRQGRKTRPNIELGICGEHGGEVSSITFCHKLGLDYVSCSPFRVPSARLAAAQAAIKLRENK